MDCAQARKNGEFPRRAAHAQCVHFLPHEKPRGTRFEFFVSFVAIQIITRNPVLNVIMPFLRNVIPRAVSEPAFSSAGEVGPRDLVLTHLSGNSTEKVSYVYMMGSASHRALYTGVTTPLYKRVWQHKNNVGGHFTSKYKCYRLELRAIHKCGNGDCPQKGNERLAQGKEGQTCCISEPIESVNPVGKIWPQTGIRKNF